MLIVNHHPVIHPETAKSNIYQAQDLGADSVMVITPIYVKLPQRGLVRFFTSMAAYGMPTVLYNVPGRTASDCLTEIIYECCSLSPNIVGVKEATGDTSHVKKLHTLFSDVETGEKMNVMLFSGYDSTSVDFCLKVSCMLVSLWYFISNYVNALIVDFISWVNDPDYLGW